MTSTAEVQRLGEQVGDVVASHGQARDAAEYSKYADDPAAFFRDVLRCEPWTKQLEMAELVRDNPRTVCVTANGLGKDWMTARMALWHVFARRGFCILTGPTERQVKQILMREVRRAFARAPELPGDLYAMELRVDDSGECGIIAFTSDNADRLTGFHHPRLLICVTEGQGVAEDAYEAVQACVTGPENRTFIYGNPTRPTGPFYRVAHSDNWARLTIRADEHPNVVEGTEVIPGAVSREWCESMAEEYGKGSSIYRSRVLAEFPSESVEGLVRREWMLAAFDRWESKELEDKAWRGRHVLALDVARFGPDASVLADIQGPVVQSLTTWRGAALTESARRVMEYGEQIAASTFGLEKYLGQRAGKRPTVYVDEPGLGGGCIDILQQKGYPAVGFNGANAPIADYSGRFLNQRAQSHWAFRTALEKGRIALPRDELLLEEALSIEWQINSAGKIQILGKELLRKELGRSPDRLDAVVIGLFQTVGGARRYGQWRKFEI